LTWYDVSINDHDRYLVNYDHLNRGIENSLRDTQPHVNWWPSTPSTGPLSFGDARHDDSSGDMHFWSVWHEGCDFDHYRYVAPRFCLELGFQSYPSMNVIRQFADTADFNIAAPVMESHQKNDGGNARIAETMFRYFRFPVDFENFVYVSQVQQALAIKTAVTQWRGLEPHCMSTLIWQLNDTWPVCSWASLDYGGGWKVHHHLAQDFYAPVKVMPDGDDLALRAVNDRREPVSVDFTAYACAINGPARKLGRGGQVVGYAATELLLVLLADLQPQEILSYGGTASDGSTGSDIFVPHAYKSYDLLPPHMTCHTARDGAADVLQIFALARAFYVTAEAFVPGRFDRNALHLGPRHTATLTFTPSDPGATPIFTLRELHSATYISGGNAMTDFSYQLYSSRDFGPLTETLGMLAALGYAHVEGYGPVYEDLDATKQALDETGLTMPSGHFAMDMVAGDPAKVIEIAKSLDLRKIVVPFLMPTDRPTNAAGWSSFGRRLAAAGKPLQDAGFDFGWHNHDFEFTALPTGELPIDLILENNTVGFEFDVAWAAVAGKDPADVIAQYGSRVIAAHVNDRAPKGENADEDGWADAGHGTLDWPGHFSALKAAGCDLFIIKHDKPADDNRFASRALAYMTSL
jgi:sugar phosphate isomerase/epimerase